jgi:ATP-dependent Clp protease adaptor protein ClpS
LTKIFALCFSRASALLLVSIGEFTTMAETSKYNSTGAVVSPGQSKPASKPKPRKLPPYNVVLLDDDHHSYAYVIQMLGELFAFPQEKAFRVAEQVDSAGRAIVMTTHKELAELKCQQICGFGADVLVAGSAGSMSAVVEPAPV